MANNADWLNTLNYIDFRRDVGRHFSVLNTDAVLLFGWEDGSSTSLSFLQSTT